MDSTKEPTPGTTPSNEATPLVTKWHILQATLAVYNQNIITAHWLVKGENFFDLHSTFGEWYKTTTEHIDEVAEHIISLKGVPLVTFGKYTQNSEILPFNKTHKDKSLLEGLNVCNDKLSTIILDTYKKANEDLDLPGIHLCLDLSSEIKKRTWMIRSWIN